MPEDVEATIFAAMGKSPADRPQSCDAFVEMGRGSGHGVPHFTMESSPGASEAADFDFAEAIKVPVLGLYAGIDAFANGAAFGAMTEATARDINGSYGQAVTANTIISATSALDGYFVNPDTGAALTSDAPLCSECRCKLCGSDAIAGI